MKPRTERVKDFMAIIDTLSLDKLRIACYRRASNLPDLDDMGQVIVYLKQEYEEKPESWLIDDIACEYNQIKDMSEHNLQIWSKYRINRNASEPITKADGNFLTVSFKGVTVDIDGQPFSITAADHITVPANHYSETGEYVSISYATMEKMLQIRGYLTEIARLVE